MSNPNGYPYHRNESNKVVEAGFSFLQKQFANIKQGGNAMRPRLIVSVAPDCNSNGIDADCSKCDFNVDNCYSRTEDELSTPAERIAALTDALKELGVTVPVWISVKDRQPEKHGEYLAATRARPRGWVMTYAPVGWICSDDYPVTHWMPLPTKPKE